VSPTAYWGLYAVGVFLVVWLLLGLRSYYRTYKGRGRAAAMATLCDQRRMLPMPDTSPFFKPMSLPVGFKAKYVNTFAAPNRERFPWISDIQDGVRSSVTDSRNDWTLMTFLVPDLNLPYIAVTRNGDIVAVGAQSRPVHFESIDFDNRFSVRADDRRFAVMLIDQGMMQWLLDFDRVNFQISGPLVSAYVRQRHPDSAEPLEVEMLFRFCDGLAAHIPQIVRSEYAVQGSHPAS
jgi:hypothetical protein